MKVARQTLCIGITAAAATLAAVWFTLGLFPTAVATAPESLSPSAVVFVPFEPTPSGRVFFDLSTEGRVGSDLLATQSDFIHLEDGWSVPEVWGTWALGESASMRLFFDQPRERTMLIRAWAPQAPDRQQRQTVTVCVNGHQAGTVRISRRPGNRYINVPSSVQRAGENVIRFNFAFSSPPAATGTGKDTRALAVGFCSIAFAEGGEQVKPPSFRSTMLAPIRRWLGDGPPAAEIDGRTGTLVARRAGTIVAPISRPPPHGRLTLRVHSPGNPHPESVIRRISVTALDGVTTRQLAVDGQQHTTSGEPLDLEVSIPAELALRAVLEIEIDPDEWTTSLQSPLFRHPPAIDGGERPDGNTPESSSVTNADRADLVVITLDAARPDHFGCYGYHRETTPHIDRLAARSTVFGSAFALAPYTLCSVPTMISGLSFLDHGVTARGNSLSQEVTTLAEHLTELGYETGCFTATPNNSHSLGFDQGYDTFWEAWQGATAEEALDPARLSTAAIGWLRGVPEDQPFHLQIHFVPPHEPYDPGPRFDVFGNESYGGPVDGSLEMIKAIDSGRHTTSSEDLERLIALYDGNLRRADAAVGALLQALEKRRRWPNTVVLITSDHGEAFLEHGRLGHNSTVFDEMLRVPFIFRLPERLHAAHEDELVTLADILPTMLSAAGGRPRSAVKGRDLLSVPEQASGASFFVARNDRNVPVTALRTPRWKLVRSGHNRVQLYDLLADPGEHTNVLHRRFAIAMGLERLLVQELQTRPTHDPAAPLAPADGDDAAMLRALGYAE